MSRATSWQYRKGTQEASDPRTDWRTVDFDDSLWPRGQAPFGFGEAGINTTLSDMQDSYSCFFLRKTFTVSTLDPDTRVRAAVDFDDGYIVWINDERVLDKNEPDGTPLHDSLASAGHESGTYETNELPDAADCLEPGENVIAVQVFNAGLASTDCKFDLELSTFQRVADTQFSSDRGFYDTAFDVTISTETPGATIRYTTTGVAPTATSGSAGGTNVVLHIATTTCLRAAAYKGGCDPTDVDTHTYLFVNDVLQQPAKPAGYPTKWRSVRSGTTNDIPADYEMDPIVVAKPEYSGMLPGALKALPTLSVVMSAADMFGTMGLYAREEEIEKPCSVELVYPPGFPEAGEGFQVDCGIQGHSWPPPSRIKRALKLYFRSAYGAGKLRYPMFESALFHADSAAEEFDCLVLRGGGNESYVGFMGDYRLMVFARDQWARDSHIAMTGYGCRGAFMHLYINGLYWGIYNPVERMDETFHAQYFGGEDEDWFWASHAWVWSSSTSDDDRWQYLVETLGGLDMTVAANYAQIQQYLKLQDFCDYITLAWYAGAGDWQESYWNNFYYANRMNPPEPGFYLAWDLEWAWYDSGRKPWQNGGFCNDGAWIKPQFLTAAEGSSWPYNSTKDKHFAKPMRSLIRNEDFRVLFADRLYRQLENDGPLADANARARWMALCDAIEDPIVPESARWGDGKCPMGLTNGNDSLTTVYRFERNLNSYSGSAQDGYGNSLTNWYSARDYVHNLMSGNGGRLIDICRNQTMNGYKVYPSLDPPAFQQHGGAVASGFKLTMSNPNSTGSIYYTLDGTDPRVAGGARAGAAASYTGPVSLSRTTHVKARVWKNDNTWSAAHAATYNYTAHYANIRITEIHYNPLGGRDFEFIEIRNTGSATRGLSELTVKGLAYTFPPGAELAGGAFLVLVRNAAAFAARYPGVAPFGVYGGGLDNGGERIALLDSDGRTVTALRYNDKAPWPPAADGDGFSLVATDTAGDQDDPAKWRASNLIGGSPGYDDGLPYRVVINEALTHTDLPEVDAIELFNAGGASADIGGWYLSDSVTDYKKFRIPSGTTLPAGGYVVFDETDFNTDTNNPACFALDSHGDEIYLTAWDANGHLQYLAEARFGGAENGVAFGRHVKTDGDADFTAQNTTHTLGAANAAPQVGPVVINEIMYHPVAGGDEFIELYNISDSNVALYDPAVPTNTWRLSAAVEYAFPAGSTLGARDYALVVATNPAAFRGRYGIAAEVQIFGPYAGVLNNAGESLKLWRPDTPDPAGTPWILVDRVQYDDNSPWPENADGDGPSLERQDAHAYGNDPANWAASRSAGGTPGAANSGVLVPATAGWKYHDAGLDLGTAWRSPSYDDGGWADGNAPLGYGDPGVYPDLDTVVDYGGDPANRHITTYFRKTFTLAAEPGMVTNMALRARYDDGFVAWLNGQELLRAALPGGTVLYDTTATSHSAADYESFDLSAQAGKLMQGLNVLAVELHQSGPSSSDIFMDIELTHAASFGNPPAAPQNLIATAQSGSRIDLRWTDASDNETGFKIDRRQSGFSEWVRVATPGANQTAYSDTGLPAGTTFYYRIKAYNADGNSPYSATAESTTQQGPPATPQNLAATAASTSRIGLSWTDMSGNETGFKIERRPGGGSWGQIATVSVDLTAHTDTGLAPATQYEYRVRATNAIGDSDYSNTGSATTLTLTVQFAASASDGSEDASPANLAVTLNDSAAQTVRVNYAATGGTATGSGTDYALANGTLTFSPGQTSRDIAVTIVDDQQEEDAETLIATLSSPSNAQLGSRTAHTYTIRDNDRLFTAYNDLCWASGQLSVNITAYGAEQAGNLVDYSSGEATPATLTATGGGNSYPDQGAPAASGTDAYSVFNGIVDCAGLINYGAELYLQFSGLDPALRYEFVIFGNRDYPAYTDRWTTTTLSDVDAFENRSTPGATFAGVGDSATVITNGWNTQNGYVARFANIATGTDGDMFVTVSDNASKCYVNAFMLKASRPGPTLPAVAFAASAPAGGEESVSPVSIAVSLDAASAEEVRVDFAPSGGTAAGGGVDYALAAGTLTFAPGQTQRTLTLTVVDDAATELDETVVLSLANPANAVLGAGTTHTYTITDNDAPAVSFTAYNDLSWDAGQISQNITAYSAFPSNGWSTSGPLVDYASGVGLNAHLSLASDGHWMPDHMTQGVDAAPGTDAHEAFAGKVDALGLLAYGTAKTLDFTSLDPALRYTVVLFGNRDGAGYTDRTSVFTLSDVAGFENTSSTGIGPDDTTTLVSGYNTANGYVARFTHIDPGADGDFRVTVGGTHGYLNAVMLQALSSAQTAVVKVPKGASWHYRRGTAEASAPPAAWRRLAFDDAGWTAGVAPFGYGDGPYGTTLDDMRYTYSSLFLRSAFSIPHSALVRELRLWTVCDDGFILWVNGEEVGRANMPGQTGSFVAYDGLASTSIGPTEWTATLAAGQLPALCTGTNVLAVQVFNAELVSSDLTFDAELSVVHSQLPVAEDADQDGMPDAWETAHLADLSDPADRADSGDPDGDGMSNLDEYVAGTDPRSAGAYFAVDLQPSNGELVVAWPTLEATGTGYAGTARYYALQHAADGSPGGAWADVPGLSRILGAGQTAAYTNTAPGAAACYRARVWLE
ncbi:MAG: lamin tail domain-containing protein [Kiritimatiellae bacterium]|nr:lamin tail domain-containing protein [Kiritimatiellia bacterium]